MNGTLLDKIEHTILELEEIRVDVIKSEKSNCELRLVKSSSHKCAIVQFPQQTTSTIFDDNSQEVNNELPRKLKYGQGSLTQKTRRTKSGECKNWQYRYYCDGVQKTITGKTRDECMQRAKDRLPNNSKTVKKTNQHTLGTWLDFWYTTFCKPHIAENTIKGYEVILRRHILNDVACIPLKNLTNTDVQILLNNVTSSRQKTATKNFLFTALKHAFNEHLIDIEPWNCVKIKKHNYKEKVILSQENQPKLFALLPENVKNAVIGYLNTGCRLEELLGVTEENIDRINNRITINGTKTDSALRTIPLFPDAANVLPLENIKARYIQDHFKIASDQLGLHMTIHDLRHTFATRCLERGINLKTVQKWLGHKSYKITADTYTHITSEFEKTEIDKYEK